MNTDQRKILILKKLYEIATPKFQQAVAKPARTFTPTVEEFYLENKSLIGVPYFLADLIDVLRIIINDRIEENTKVNFSQLDLQSIKIAIKAISHIVKM